MPQGPRLKAAIYARVSTADQNYAMQLREVTDFATRQGWDIAEYTEKASAVKKRPVLDSLMEDARQRKFDVVLVWKLDRFGRSVRDLTDRILQLDRWGIRFVCVTQSIDTDQHNPTARLLLHVLAAVAEFERELIRERVLAGRARYHADFEAGRIGKEAHSKSGKDLPAHRPKRVFNRDKARKLRAAGHSLRSIAKTLGVPVTTIHDCLKTP